MCYSVNPHLLSYLFLLKETETLFQYYENLTVNVTTGTEKYNLKIDNIDDILIIIDPTKKEQNKSHID
jgi:hypothetical protein